jgi:hypothetical protein
LDQLEECAVVLVDRPQDYAKVYVLGSLDLVPQVEAEDVADLIDGAEEEVVPASL